VTERNTCKENEVVKMDDYSFPELKYALSYEENGEQVVISNRTYFLIRNKVLKKSKKFRFDHLREFKEPVDIFYMISSLIVLSQYIVKHRKLPEILIGGKTKSSDSKLKIQGYEIDEPEYYDTWILIYLDEREEDELSDFRHVNLKCAVNHRQLEKDIKLLQEILMAEVYNLIEWIIQTYGGVKIPGVEQLEDMWDIGNNRRNT
jgi:hypothetical protein